MISLVESLFFNFLFSQPNIDVAHVTFKIVVSAYVIIVDLLIETWADTGDRAGTCWSFLLSQFQETFCGCDVGEVLLMVQKMVSLPF